MTTEQSHEASHSDHGCGCGGHEAHAEPPKPQEISAELQQTQTQ